MTDSDLELNKIAAAILVMGLVMMVVGKVSDVLYHPEEAEKRGFEVEVVETASAGAGAKQEEQIDLAALLAVASVDAGKVVAKKCVTCHSFEQGGPVKTGPNLWGVVGKKVAGDGGYNYSKAMKAKGGNWTYDELYAYLRNPKKAVKGTKMAFAGIRKPKDIASILLYLRSQGSSGVPLP